MFSFPVAPPLLLAGFAGGVSTRTRGGGAAWLREGKRAHIKKYIPFLQLNQDLICQAQAARREGAKGWGQRAG